MKNILAGIAGFVTIVALSIGTDVVIHATGVIPNDPNGLFDTVPLLIALTYRVLYAFLGGYVVARLAEGNVMKVVTVFNCIGLIPGIAGAVANSALGPVWYSAGIVVLSFLAIFAGANVSLRTNSRG